MAAATVTNTEYGYMVTGGTDATTVNTGRIWVTGLAHAGDDDDDTCTLTTVSNGSDVSAYKFKTNGGDDDASYQYAYFGELGIPMSGLKITLGDADSILYIFIR